MKVKVKKALEIVWKKVTVEVIVTYFLSILYGCLSENNVLEIDIDKIIILENNTLMKKVNVHKRIYKNYFGSLRN